jgi:hypothetical protein
LNTLQKIKENSAGLPLLLDEWIRTSINLNNYDSVKSVDTYELLQALRDRYDHVQAYKDTPIPTYKDTPTEFDELGRRPFAKVLANRIDRIRTSSRKLDETDAFILHLHGPWGSGKSSLLNFIREELEEKPTGWIVIEFNAWKNQRTGPPWWSLMDAVYTQSKIKLKKKSVMHSYLAIFRQTLRLLLIANIDIWNYRTLTCFWYNRYWQISSTYF